jgi:hypothetical protein
MGRKRRPGRPRKRLLEGYKRQDETGNLFGQKRKIFYRDKCIYRYTET